MRCRFLWVLAALCPFATAEPLPAGDSGLRHDITLLSDSGVLTAPVTGWPLASSDLAVLSESKDLPVYLDAARRRVLAAIGLERRALAAAGGIGRDFTLRGYESMPREDAEATVGFDMRTERYTINARMTYVNNPTDGREWRADGSQAGFRLGNWWLGASATDRWWGPGWDGSLILSNNARPVPALVLQRERADPFESRWLSWLGPWTTQVIWGQLEHDRDRGNARLFGWRIGVRPLPRLELGLSRTGQWCGSGRPCSASTFFDFLSGVRDNSGENIERDDEPGNQLAGFDLRFTFDALQRPWAFYGQRIGEDELNGLPSSNLTLVGLATWGGGTAGGSYRVHAEFAETSCGGFTGSDPIFGCAYEHSIYTDGYRYRGRSIGHSQDGDGRVFSAGLILKPDTGSQWRAGVRSGRLNRDSRSLNPVAEARADVIDLELLHERDTDLGTLKVGIGAEQRETDGQSSTWYGRAFMSFEMSLPAR